MTRSWLLGGVCVALAACSDSSGSQFDAGLATDAADDGGPTPNVKGDASPNSGDGGLNLFYANDDHSLYQLDPASLDKSSMKLIGDFDCVPSQTTVMTDIAVSKDGKLFGVRPTAAWPLTIQTVQVQVANDAGAPNDASAVDGGPDDGSADGSSVEGGSVDGGSVDAGFTTVTQTIVHCGTKWPLAYGTHFNGLSFAPENTIAAEEVLVGGNALGNLYAIDATSGNPTIVGSLGIDPDNKLPWGVSGDIVFMANSGAPIGFVTARTCTSTTTCDPVDTLLEIDVNALKLGNSGSVIKAIRGPIKRGASCSSGPTQFGAIFGIVASGAKVYGFSRWGDFIAIDNDTGAGCLDWTATGINFAGAGITTTATVVAPPPR